MELQKAPAKKPKPPIRFSLAVHQETLEKLKRLKMRTGYSMIALAELAVTEFEKNLVMKS